MRGEKKKKGGREEEEDVEKEEVENNDDKDTERRLPVGYEMGIFYCSIPAGNPS